MTPGDDNWAAGDAYESYMGRWSRPLARAFVKWLDVPPGKHWLDVGCGTGALAAAVCELAEPASVLGCDPSEPFVLHARRGVSDVRASFMVAGVEALPGGADYDCVVSALALNFMTNPADAVSLMRERLRRGGILAAYVWDYGDGIEFLRHFWDEAVALDPGAADLDEGRRFSQWQPEFLRSLFVDAGLGRVAADVLEIPTHFKSLDDFWAPFERGTGPAPSYAAALPNARREMLRDRLARALTIDADGSIRMNARAFVARGLSK